ncbi:thymidine phosphorylase [Thermaurantiacus sp.]
MKAGTEEGGKEQGGVRLVARRPGLGTHGEAVILLRTDSAVVRAEGLGARPRVAVAAHGRQIHATVMGFDHPMLGPDDVILSDDAADRLGVTDGEPVTLSHPAPLPSLSHLRRRLHGLRLGGDAFRAMVQDLVAHRWLDTDAAAFIAACAAFPLDFDEMVALTGAMVEAGERLTWPVQRVFDKHGAGGLPGNRTTPIVVAICAANGLVMPKTSSRAITSPAGTADTMEVLTNVQLSTEDMRRVVEAEGACFAWGGAVALSPADDILIRTERALEIDTMGQLVASILSKKLAAGSTDVLVEIPVGPTAKLREAAAAEALSAVLVDVGAALGIRVKTCLTDGRQPVGRGIGPALEARDVLAVLRATPEAPPDLRARALRLAARLLETAGAAKDGAGALLAEETLASGRAYARFERICRAQGAFLEPGRAPLQAPVRALRSGTVTAIDNRRLASLARLAGAPETKEAGLDLHVRLGDRVACGEPLLTVHAETSGELGYALSYAQSSADIITVTP